MIDYDFKTLNSYEYELKLDMEAKNKFIELVFRTMKRKLKIKKASMKDINKIAIDTNFFKLIHTAISPRLKDIFKIVSNDGVLVVSDRVEKAEYVRNGAVWDINVIVRGEYAEKV
jgi:hypothetical protein